METQLRKRRRRVGQAPLLPEIPFTSDWNITANITEEELKNILTDLYHKYKNWDDELAKANPPINYDTRKEYLEKSTPFDKFQREINEIQLSVWHRLIGIRSNKYSATDIANTVTFLLLLKAHPVKCPKEKEFVKF